MTTIKVKFRASKVSGKQGTIYYQLIKDQVVRHIGTKYKLFLHEWGQEESNIVMSVEDQDRCVHIDAIRQQIQLDCSRLKQVIASFEVMGDYFDINMVVAEYRRWLGGATLFDFMSGQIVRLRELNRFRTAETYQTTLNSFTRFRKGVDVLLVDLTSNLIMDYEAYLKSKHIVMNTISFYMRVLRAVYNKAVDQELIDQRNPFKRVYTGIDKTVKRAISLKDLKRIKELDFSSSEELAYARDMFLFSFYTRGMAFVDMTYLRCSDLHGGILSYRRRKTGQQLHVKWEACMQEIVNRYKIPGSKYLLPFISDPEKDDRMQYKNQLTILNCRLKKVADMVDLQMPLTMYVARHSWASVAKSRNIPLSVISEGMGHDSETTTQIYLASLDTAVVDRANTMILKLL